MIIVITSVTCFTPSTSPRSRHELFPEPKADRRVNLWTQVNVAGVNYLRLPLQTRWLDETDDLVLALKESLEPARPGDTVE